MPPLVAQKRAELDRACPCYGVGRLELFGSAAGETFDPARSDLDFLVTFRPEARKKALDNYFDLLECLEALLGRPVELVTARLLKDPYVLRAIDQQRQLVPGA